MSKPRDVHVRHAILGAFDNKAICSIRDISEYLNSTSNPLPEHSIRFFVKAMCGEGLLKLFKRGKHNQAFYTKGLFPNATTLLNLKGEPVTLVQFISELDALSEHPLINGRALTFLKEKMLLALASSDKQAFIDKKIEPPVASELKSDLVQLRQAIEQLHRYVKTFLDADVWGEVGRDRVAKELDGLGIIPVIVDRYGE